MKLGPEQMAVTIDKWQVASGNSWVEAAEALIYNEKIDIETE